MKMSITSKRNATVIFYLGTLVVFGLLMFWITRLGADLEREKMNVSEQFEQISPVEIFTQSVNSNLHHPLAILILQIVTIIVVSRAFGFVFNKIGQPTVIGEIIAGIVLGPSLLGLVFPEVSAFVFPPQSLPNLQFLSQVGLILFMFVIGMELDLKVLRNQAHDAVVISHASIIIPYFLGMGLAYFLYIEFAPPSISFTSFALFMGIAMSITAFPVLARVIQERDLTRTRIGTIAITCAAADDITAWCILAAVIAIVKAGTFVSALFTIALAIVYVLVMIFLVQPLLRRLGNVYSSRETISKTIVAIIFLILLSSAFAAEVIGIHALFGAFLAGVIMPPNFNFRKVLMDKVEDVSLVLLLPLFFVFTGLRTQIGLLNEGHLWVICLVIILVAVAGKFGGSMMAARFVGQSWKDSLSLGALMNTRGLMELVVLNIGYDLGVLSPEVFAMMVIMALVTTFMTGPALDAINYIFKSDNDDAADGQRVFKILLSFGPPIKGKKLLRLADQITHKEAGHADITALHLTPSADINPKEHREYERESFRLVRHEADSLGIKIKTVYKATNDINREILREAARYDLLLIGGSKSVFTDDVVGGKVKNYLDETECQVGVLVDKDFEIADRVVVYLQDYKDLFLILFVERLIHNNNAIIQLFDPNRLIRHNTLFANEVNRINKAYAGAMNVYENHSLARSSFGSFNLMVISYGSWKTLNPAQTDWMQYTPSILILKPGKDNS